MKQLTSRAFYVISVLSLSLATVGAQSVDNALPTLRGGEAIEKLKQTGQYDSLMDAVQAARKDNGQTVNAVGQSSKLVASDGSIQDFFGSSVSVNGDTAIVGAPNDDIGANLDQGSAYVFVRSGTTWSQQQQLTASDGAAQDRFGVAVAIYGDTAIIGANLDDVGLNSNQGSAYAFVRSGTTWTQQQKLTAADGAANDEFGFRIAISGDTAIIGAYQDDVDGNPNQGSAYVFVRDAATWTQQARLASTISPGGSDQFGRSVGISGDTAVVGANLADSFPNANNGAAYVFVRSGTNWTEQIRISGPGAESNNGFGTSVAIAGDTFIVGAPSADVIIPDDNRGSAFVYVRNGTSWSQQQQLTAADGASGDQFGTSVAVTGDTAIVGAPGDDIGSLSNQGSAIFFVRSDTTWSQQQKLTAADGERQDAVGISIAISGSTTIVGASGDDIGGNDGQGSAYVFRVLSNTWTQEAKQISTDGMASDNFGYSVAISGDTAIVGAVFDDVVTGTDQGSAYIFVRNGTSWTQQQQLTASDAAGSDYFGVSVAIYGDTAIVGAYNADVGTNTNQGSAYIFVRSGSFWTQQQKLTASDGAANDGFGLSVGISGDTVIVGAFADDVSSNTNQGSAYVFVRSGSTWSQQQKLTALDGAAEDYFGWSVAISAGTAIISSYLDDIGANANQGSAYVFVRSGSTWSQQQQLTATAGAADDTFGISVSISEDTAIVGAYLDDVGANVNQGSAYVFVRSGTSWTQQQQLTASDGAVSDTFGISVSISGDTAVVGANFDDVGANPDQGSAYVFERAGTTWTQRARLTDNSGAASDFFGNGVAVSGDKIVVGAPYSDASVSTPLVPQATDQGAAIFFVNAPLGPTAASVSVSGRVMTPYGAGLTNARVSITDTEGHTRSAVTSSFGFYQFDEIEVGQTYIVSVSSKRYQFQPRVITVYDEVAKVDFTAEPLKE